MLSAKPPTGLARLDARLFEAVAGGRTPWLDRLLPRLSRSADHGLLWIVTAGALAASGGRAGRAAAASGLRSTALTSLLVNQGIKRVVRRPRPPLTGVPAARRVPMPATTSFPSGHAASAAAFATGAAAELSVLRLPLGVFAAAVGISRVYVGVHYPLDVLVGAAVGAAVARAPVPRIRLRLTQGRHGRA
jgi:membrane-associated phospholipid phosphatase